MSFFHSLLSAGGSEALPQATAPSPLIANSLDTTTANVSWNDTGADNYILQRATQSDYSDATQVYSGNNKSFDDTGLSIGTRYYYRVKGQEAGKSDSDWATDHVQTISFMPLAWYEPAGMVNLTDNAYVTMSGVTNNRVTALKSIVNTSGPLATFQANLAGRIKADDSYAYQQLNDNNDYADLNGAISLAGPFTICMKIKVTGSFSNNQFCSSSGTNFIRFNSLSQIIFVVSGINTILNWNSAFVVGYHYDVVLQRSAAGIIRISNDGGATWATAGAANNNTVTISRLFASSFAGSAFNEYVNRLVIDDSELSDSQIDEIFNYLKRPDYTPEVVADPSEIVLPDGLTWSSFSGGYIVDSNFDKTASSSHIRERIEIIADRFAVILLNYKNEAPTYGEDVIYVWDLQENLLAGPIREFPVLANSTNDHTNGSILKFSGRIWHVEQLHYGTFESTPFVFKQSNYRYNLKNFNTVPLARGVSNDVGTLNQYHQFNRIGNSVFLYTQEQTPSGSSPYVNVWKTTDGFNSWEKNRIVDAASVDWFYYYVPRNDGATTYLFLQYLNFDSVPADPDQYPYCFLLKTTDGYTFSNVAGTFSKDVRNGNEITLAELMANCVFTTAAATKTAYMTAAVIDDVGEVSGIASNGSDTGFDWFFISAGTTTKRAMDFGARSVITTLGVLADQSLAFWKVNDNEYHAILYEDNAGVREVAHYKTMDKGVTTEFVGIIANDATKDIDRVVMNKDNPRDSWVVLAATRVESSTEGTPFLYKIAK